jgi:hypothetical protein
MPRSVSEDIHVHAHTSMADESKSWARFTARLLQTRANARGEEGGRGSGSVCVCLVGRGGEVGAAAHCRTCTRWLLLSATTMRPSLSMAMPPFGHLNSPLPEPSLPMVRTCAPSL